MNNEAYLFRLGKKSKDGRDTYVSYTSEGKVIIGKNCTSKGFYRLVETDERERYILAKVEPVYYDYYDGMSYKDLKKMLITRGYNIAFEMPFENYNAPELRLVAYNRKFNLIVVADTIGCGTRFNSIRCYSYLKRGTTRDWRYIGLYKGLISFDSETVTCFSIVDSTYRGIFPLTMIEKVCAQGDIGKIAYQDMPQGFTYADILFGDEDFYSYRDKFYNLCPSGLKKWFEAK